MSKETYGHTNPLASGYNLWIWANQLATNGKFKKIVKPVKLFLLFLPFTMSAQPYFGENWTNVPENLTDEVIELINAQIPVGQTYFACFRNDKYAEDKVKNGVTTPGIDKAPQWEIDQVIKLKNKLVQNGKGFGMIYTFDTRGRCSADDAFFAFDQFVDAGVWIPAGRGGNEEFAKIAGHPTFDHYTSFTIPIRTRLAQRNWTGWFSIPLDRYNSTKDWNIKVISYCASDPTLIGDIHFYWNDDFIAAQKTLQVDANGDRYLPPVAASPTYLSTHDNYYRDSYFQTTSSTYIEDQMGWYNLKFPGKPCTITEFGPSTGVGPLGGALGFNAAEDWFYNKIKNRADVFCVLHFNGPNTPTGSSNGRSKYDPVSVVGEVVPRLSYLTAAQFRRNIDALPFPTNPILLPGTYTFSLHNMIRTQLDPVIPVAPNLRVESFEYESISGNNYYSSSGPCAWWANGSVKSYEISGSQYSSNIPALSYGYIHVTIESVCYDTAYTVIDTTYIETETPAPCPERCGRLFYSLFNKRLCVDCGKFIKVTTPVYTERQVTETICD